MIEGWRYILPFHNFSLLSNTHIWLSYSMQRGWAPGGNKGGSSGGEWRIKEAGFEGYIEGVLLLFSFFFTVFFFCSL